MDPEIPLAPTRLRSIIFDRAHHADAWEINPRAMSATYFGPSTETVGTVVDEPTLRQHVTETCDVSLPLTWLYLQFLRDHRLLEALHQPVEPIQVAPLAAAAPVEAEPDEIEEDPEEYFEEDFEIHSLASEDDPMGEVVDMSSPDMSTSGVGDQSDFPSESL